MVVMTVIGIAGSIPSRRSRKRRKRSPRKWLPALVLVVVVIGISAYYSLRTVEPPEADRPYLVYLAEIQEFPVIIENKEPYIPLSFIKEQIDPNVYWDESGVMVVTTKDKVIKLKTDSLTAYVNRHPAPLQFPVILVDEEPYVPSNTLQALYPVSTTYNAEAGMFLVRRLDRMAKVGKLTSDAFLRLGPSVFSPRVKEIKEGTEVVIYSESGRWLKVETKDGLCGFVRTKQVANVFERPPEVNEVSDYVPKSLEGDKVVLAWEQVYSARIDTSKIGDMPGLNVVSPTWFHLSDDQGGIENRGDINYVDWAHSKGYQVWALFSNSFNPERTSKVLRDSEIRDRVISQILVYCKIYKLDGINIDFENVYLDDGPYLTQFVREITPLLHEQGLTVSIDVTVRSESPNWSLFLERDKLSDTVDYVMLMSYDQYPQGSHVAGPVSSIPWTESNIETTLLEVPSKKLVLGIPFYTRLWEETKEEGETKITCKALGMESVSKWLREHNPTTTYQEETGLLYAEKTVGNKTYKVWIEDKDSVEKRVQLVNKYNLAGVAAWSRGFETPDIWHTIANTIE